MGRSQTTFKKREKEMKRKEKRERKMQRRLEKKALVEEGGEVTPPVDSPDEPTDPTG